MKNYTVYHSHSDLSNATTTLDSVTKFRQYIDKAEECGMKAFAFSEHGNIFEWLHKKEYIESKGMKYIHGVEAYITITLDEKIRDNFHLGLYAKNYDGFKEINELMSEKKAFNREDGHFYYQPRITYDELKNTSDNVIITTACLGNILYSSNDKELKKDFVKFLTRNKHRSFLEIQHHNVKDQISYNQLLYKISQKTGLKLIAGTDTHALNKEHLEGRIVLQKAKNIHFENEDGWDLSFKSYGELVNAYEIQNSLPKDVYLVAIENTNVFANMIEEFKIDRSHKYPKLYDNSEEVFKNKIKDYIKERNISLTEERKNRINHEFNTYKKNGAIDYILLEEDLKSWCRSKGYEYGYSRGSVSGSYIAYLLKITDMDSIKHVLNFERFMNPERVSLCDIDSDFAPSQRDFVKQYLYDKEGLYCADIITFNTIAMKGAIRDVGRSLKIPLDEVDVISKNVDDKEKDLREKYPELFKYVDLLSGVIVSIGTHPAGLLVSPIPMEGVVGTCTLKTSNNPVTQLNMKEIDSMNFVKLDLLGLDNVEIINEACKLAKIERLTPDNIDDTDENVWNSIHDSGLGVFQWESETAHRYYQKLFSKETLSKIKEKNPNVRYMDLLSIGNGAIRPAGDSYREALARGEFKDNGHIALNEFLSPTNGFLVFQEQIIEFLNKYCGFTMGEADLVRRGFSKKLGTDEYMPKIKAGFIKTMLSDYNIKKEEAEQLIIDFVKVIEDASSYLFSINHSQSYSYIGYVCAYLRHYYPFEFLTSILNVNKDKQDKTTKIIEYIGKFTNIEMKPIKFRFSKANYMMSKETNGIYNGIESIKHLNAKVGEELYSIKDNKYETFVDLLIDVAENSRCNSGQMKILIKLNFFSEFGGNKKLLNIYEVFENRYKKTHVEKTKIKRIEEVKELQSTCKEEELLLNEQAECELEYLGYIKTIIPNIPMDYAIITEVDRKYKNPMIYLYRVRTGETEKVKVKLKDFDEKVINKFDMIKTIEVSMEGRWKKTEKGGWKQDHNDKEPILKKWSYVKFNK